MLVPIIFSGCTPPVTYVIDLAYAPPLSEAVAVKQEQERIAVIPFEDARTEKRMIGKSKRLMGKIDNFESNPSPVSDAVTQALVRALKIKGYQTEILKPGTDPEAIKQSPPNIVLSGKIDYLWAYAIAKTGRTNIKVDVRMKMKIYKVDDKTGFTMNVQSQSEPKVVLFTPSVMQNAINDTLTDAINHVIATKWKE
ncbi:MAG: hypothetical protein HZA08_01665 [Nitrospirae bacterium]|nr:hypothetical protein [Nitrospirota bacterium]